MDNENNFTSENLIELRNLKMESLVLDVLREKYLLNERSTFDLFEINNNY